MAFYYFEKPICFFDGICPWPDVSSRAFSSGKTNRCFRPSPFGKLWSTPSVTAITPSPVGAVNVAIFDDRLEISSAGLLPFGLTVPDLKRNHQSLPRNPLLANVFYLRGLIERW